jgi:hypothetical protein
MPLFQPIPFRRKKYMSADYIICSVQKGEENVKLSQP